MNEQPFYGKRVIIVHGYTASPSANWFPWLRDTLAAQGAQVLLPSMPDSQSPQPLAWAQTLDKLLPHADTSTFLIGHSLGCVALMRHLQSMPLGTRIGGYVLVSGFDCGLSTLPELAAFTSSPLNYAVLRERAAHRASIISADDAIVAPQASHQLAEALQTRVVEVKNGGHFLDRDGYTSLPPVYETLQAML